MNPVNRYALLDGQVPPHSLDSTFAEFHIVVFGTGGIGSSFQYDDSIRVLHQSIRNLIEHIGVLRIQGGAVQLELNRFLVRSIELISVLKLSIESGDVGSSAFGCSVRLSRLLIDVLHIRFHRIELAGCLRIEFGNLCVDSRNFFILRRFTFFSVFVFALSIILFRRRTIFFSPFQAECFYFINNGSIKRKAILLLQRRNWCDHFDTCRGKMLYYLFFGSRNHNLRCSWSGGQNDHNFTLR